MAMMFPQSMYRPIAASLLIDHNCAGKGQGTQCPGLFIFIHQYRSLMPTRPDYTRYYLVLRQGCIDEFSVTVVFRNTKSRRLQARHSTQAMAKVLVKCCNAVVEHHSNARRVGLSGLMAVLRLLQRTMAIYCKARLALNPDRPTESINTTL